MTTSQSLALADARKAVRNDPTGTQALRRKWRSATEMRLRQLRARLRVAVIDNDVLGLQGGGQLYQPEFLRLRSLQEWFERMALGMLGGPWCAPFVKAAWQSGLTTAMGETRKAALFGAHAADHLEHLAQSENAGIAAALTQQVVRASVAAVTQKLNTRRAYAMMVKPFDKMAVHRLRANVNVVAVKAHNDAKLASYREAGVTHVGILPESRQRKVTHDHAHDAFDPSESRDPHGEWTSGGGGGVYGTMVEHGPPVHRTSASPLGPWGPQSPYRHIRDAAENLAKAAKVDVGVVVDFLEDPHVDKVLKSIDYRVDQLVAGQKKLAELTHTAGLLDHIKAAANVKLDKLDEHIAQHPVLSKVTGYTLAALDFSMWVSTISVGHFEADLPTEKLRADAITHTRTLKDFIQDLSPKEILGIVGNFVLGLTIKNLARASAGILAMLVYNGIKKFNPAFAKSEENRKLAQRIHMMRHEMPSASYTAADAFDPEEPRDDRGEWSGRGGAAAQAGKHVTLYHGTSEKYLASIRKYGLRPGHGGGADKWLVVAQGRKALTEMKTMDGRKASVYLTKTRDDAEMFASATSEIQWTPQKPWVPVVLQIRVPATEYAKHFREDKRYAKSGAVRTTSRIPPEWIVDGWGQGAPKAPHKGSAYPRVQSEAEIKKLYFDADDDIEVWAVVLPDDDDMEATDAFDPDEERDQQGKWTAVGAGPGGKTVTLYHGTSEKYLAKIRKQGLQKGHRGGADTWLRSVKGGQQIMNEMTSLHGAKLSAVYVSKTKSSAEFFAESASALSGEQSIILKLKVPLADFKRSFREDARDRGAGSFRTLKNIPPEWIVAEYRKVEHAPVQGEVGLTLLNRPFKKTRSKDTEPDDSVELYVVVAPVPDDDEMDAQDAGWEGEERDPHGEWTSGFGGAAVESALGHGYSHDAKLIEGVIHTSNVYDAARALYENRKVELNQPHEVSMLLDHLGQVAKHMIAMGGKAPTFNLCNVVAAGTNLFCAEAHSIPRVKMPQLPEGAEGEAGFKKFLTDRGYKITESTEDSYYLRPTQNELNGVKVAKLAKIFEEGGRRLYNLFVSRDNYIVDGHHRWAADIGLAASRGSFKGEVRVGVERVNAGIIELLNLANQFTHKAGRVGVEVTKGQRDSLMMLDWNPDEPRDEHGEWTSGGSSGESGVLAAPPPLTLTHYGNERLQAIHTVPIEEQGVGFKPKGLWFSAGGEWIEWAKGADFDTGTVETRIKLHPDANVIHIQNEKQFDDFDAKYGAALRGAPVGMPGTGSDAIDWKRVAKDYQGIVIAPYIGSRRYSSLWYYGWDVASGCIWNAGALSIKDAMWGDVGFSDYNPDQPREPTGSPEGGRWAGGGSGEMASPPPEDAQRLYRGDAGKIENFDVDATNVLNLFGQGIYLTSSRRVAADYTSKGGAAGDVLFRYSSRGAITKKEVVDKYVDRMARKFDADGKDHADDFEYWTHDVPFSSGRDWGFVGFSKQDDAERAKRLGFARAKWTTLAKEYDVRVKLDHTAVIQRKAQAQNVTTFDVPKTVLDATLDADAEVPDKVLDELTSALTRAGDGGTARDITNYVSSRERGDDDSDGYRPSFRELYTGITANSPLTSDTETQASFREALSELGYTGIKYAGGRTMGGGFNHTAYVLWDDPSKIDENKTDLAAPPPEHSYQVLNVPKGINAQMSQDTEVLVNPAKHTFFSFLHEAGEIRTMVDKDDNVYVWPAANGTHDGIAGALGLHIKNWGSEIFIGHAGQAVSTSWPLTGYEKSGGFEHGMLPPWIEALPEHTTDSLMGLFDKGQVQTESGRAYYGGRSGPASRVAREDTPSASTIYRVEKAQEALAEEVGEQVGVETAGDELVCEDCQDIADGGPYDLDEAQGLIPQHANCRCSFFPWQGDRVANDDSESRVMETN